MHCVLFAMLAEFLDFQAILKHLLVFVGVVVDAFAYSTLQFDHVILRHIRVLNVAR